MTVYAITDTKKGRTGIAPTYLHTTPRYISRTTFWFVDTHTQTHKQTRWKQYQLSLRRLVYNELSCALYRSLVADLHVLAKVGGRVTACQSRRTWSQFLGCVDCSSIAGRRRDPAVRRLRPPRSTRHGHLPSARGRCCSTRRRWSSSSAAERAVAVRLRATSWVVRSAAARCPWYRHA